MLLRIKRLFKEHNRGVALILSIIVVSVLFIFTSFLVRRVVTNTLMVGRTKDELTNYALAKEGILYAVNQLNTSNEATDWPGKDDKDWYEYDIDHSSEHLGNDVRIRVDKDDLPPKAFSLISDNSNPDYITIESQDLKKSVTLQGISNYTCPLLKYARFINSDVSFSSEQTFGDVGNGTPTHINGNLTLTGANTIYLDTGRGDKFEVTGQILATNSSDTVTVLDQAGTPLASLDAIAGNGGNNGFSLVYDSESESWIEKPEEFNTVSGHYFDGAHLPSSYDCSGTSPQYVNGTGLLFWPHINEERYKNLASGTNCHINNPDEINMETEWSDPTKDNDTRYDNDTADEWFNDGYGSIDPSITSTSYHYYPCAARLILNKNDITEVLFDGTTNSINYSDITNGVIFAEGDISVSGIIPAEKKLTIVSGGNIFIDSNLLKEANSASLALLAKEHIVLNPTLRYGVDTGNTSANDSWYQPDYVLGNPDSTDSNYTSPTDSSGVTLQPDDGNPEGQDEKIYTLDIDLGKLVTSGRVVLWNYKDAEDAYPSNLKTELEVWITRQATPPDNDSDWDKKILPYTDVDTTPFYTIDFTPQTFRWLRLNLLAHNIDTTSEYTFDLSKECLDAIEVALYGIDACLFAENGSLKVITGGGVNQDSSILPNNDAYKPEDSGGLKIPSGSGTSTQDLFFWGTLAEHSQEPINEWAEKWPDIAYIYDFNLASNPPPDWIKTLPSSVNLVSLRRK